MLIGSIAAVGVILMGVGIARRAADPPATAPAAATPVSSQPLSTPAVSAASPLPEATAAATTEVDRAPASSIARDEVSRGGGPSARGGSARKPGGRPLTIAEFLERPEELDGSPTDVGGCRLVEHWNTGYCYVWSRASQGRVSERTDARCDDLPELRSRLRAAIDRGDCK